MNNKTFTAILISILILSTPVSAQDMKEMWGSESSKKSENKQESKAWFKESKYAMFIHWGLYSQVAGKWKGETFYGIGEWIMKMKKIPVAQYQTIALDFNPVKFNAKEWVQLAKEAGMKYIVITAKHHDGFAMFKSSHPYNIVDATPFSRDPLKELAEECKKNGIKLGFYYSQNQDWNEINDWDQSKMNTSFDSYFQDKAQSQVKELLTNYGEIGLIWFDTPGNMTKEQSLSLVKTVNKLQPNALINSRIGNGVGDYSTYGDHQIPSKNIAGLWEAINTSNDSWGATWYDQNWKSPTQIVKDLVTIVARGGNYMFNVGPLADGTIPNTASMFLQTSGKWVKKHEEAIYGTSPSPWEKSFSWGDCTVKGNKLYLFVFDWQPGSNLNIFGLKNKIKSAVIDEKSINFNSETSGWTSFQLPLRKQKQLIEVIEVELEGAPIVNTELSIDDTVETILGADFAITQGCELVTSSWMEKFGTWKHAPSISNWESTNCQASWVINIKEPGTYFVDLEYNSFIDSDENEWDIFTDYSSKLRYLSIETTGAKKFTGWPPVRYRFRRERAGTIHISKAGRQTITIKAATKLKGGGMQLKALHLIPVKLY
jgi:alpha-L-fucosidase